MSIWSADLLEFESLREIVRRYVYSPQGRANLDAMGPITDRAALEELTADLREAIAYLGSAEEVLRFSDVPEIGESIAKLRIEGSSLDPLELRGVLVLIERTQDLRAAIVKVASRYPRLANHAAAIEDLRGTVRALAGKILPDGTISDDASAELRRIRQQKLKQQKAIQDSLERFLKTHREDGVLQEDFVTIRNDRFVVPLVPSQKGKVDGVVHGSSASGQTVFVEPLATIALNNELVRLNEEELRECHRILREMTARLREDRAAIQAASIALGDLDFLFGKASFGRAFDACVPEFSAAEAPKLNLLSARHPLLIDVFRKQRKAVVPLTFELTAGARTLLISGPNTGGKTVAMKCVGLFALMAQSGLPLPAEQATMPVFDQVLADIGDNQSIAESLSSFSSHVMRVGEIHEVVTPDSLVILDELGRATDPDEGGALAVTLLDDFRAVGAFTFASTHLMPVKVWGSTTAGVINASMGFNEETLEPTYKLRLGAPGKSAGLDIAARLGLPPRVIEQSRSRLGTAERDIGRFLNELHQKVDAAAAHERALAAERAALAERERKLAEDSAKREAAKIREIEARFEEALEQFQSNAAATLTEIEQRQAADKARLKTAKVKREFSEQVRTIVSPSVAEATPGRAIAVGARVRLQGIREIARVRRVLDHDVIEVEAGFLKVQVPKSDVIEVLDDAPDSGPKLPKNVSFDAGPSWTMSQREINVIGRRAEEAAGDVDKFLDSASLASVDRVRIVHGHGMGVLKKTIHDLLKAHPHVEKFYPATPAEGGTGATIAELR